MAVAKMSLDDSVLADGNNGMPESIIDSRKRVIYLEEVGAKPYKTENAA